MGGEWEDFGGSHGFQFQGKWKRGVICRRQSIKGGGGGGLQKIDRQSNAHNKMGEWV